jgi:hypothetical protein
MRNADDTLAKDDLLVQPAQLQQVNRIQMIFFVDSQLGDGHLCRRSRWPFPVLWRIRQTKIRTLLPGVAA